MKKTLLAAALVMVSGSALAIDGQIDFYGRVAPGTCETHIVNKNGSSIIGDGEVRLQTAQIADITSAVQAQTPGAKAEDFAITADCQGAIKSLALTMSSPAYAANDGTLKNNTNVTVGGSTAAKNVNIAVHDVTSGTPTLVKMNDASDAHILTLSGTSEGTYYFKASYVRADGSQDVTDGHVTTNALYTINYD
ncbi:fimbrial protein [Salmonella enterica subsp. enterica]|nr:fimbrial protein [Salmonella enterica]EBF8124547.1 fimbrial protein [Salmonella enterica subsp. enterica]EBU7939013.1 fimbrial protein [Salmonella enterica subsp. enterica serovar Chittagong]EBY5127737.1 fimbrial protein [Salmonella enterica subsp. enterica serovar Brazzaville]EDH3992522.1 fimbrial protein [Salmonella enterica subsp. enterica serovar Westminster]EDN7240418.1 fimbrial protein [Salmonella enterica subsp. enterica serovar Thompson]EEF3249874.1 fimbrial protein [Salmonella ent